MFKYFNKTCTDMHHKHKSICMIFCYGDFFNWDSLPARMNSHCCKAWSYKKKKHKKIKAYRKSVQKEPTIKKCLNYSRLQVTKIIGQGKTFYRQTIPESSCASKETVDIDIFVPSQNVDRKIMQSIRIMSRPPSTKKNWNQLSRF